MLHLDPVDWISHFSTAVHMEEVAIKSTLICSMICMSPWQRLIGAKPESELILAFMEIIASVRDVTKPRFRSGLFLCCSKEHWSIRSFLMSYSHMRGSDERYLLHWMFNTPFWPDLIPRNNNDNNRLGNKHGSYAYRILSRKSWVGLQTNENDLKSSY